LNFIFQFLLLSFALNKSLLQKLDFGIDLFKLSLFLAEVCLLFFDCFFENGQLATERFSLRIDNVVLIHAFDPHLKILGCKGRFGDLVKVELRSGDNSSFQSLHRSIRNIVLVVDLNHLDQTHQILHQKLSAHFEVVFLLFADHTRLRFFVDDLSSVCHDPIPEENDQTSAYSHHGNRGVVKALDFI
jgi:hypothetical protein